MGEPLSNDSPIISRKREEEETLRQVAGEAGRWRPEVDDRLAGAKGKKGPRWVPAGRFDWVSLHKHSYQRPFHSVPHPQHVRHVVCQARVGLS